MERIYVVMGVSGSGKTVIGTALARRLGLEFSEGDTYHPAENVARMSAGIPLTDDDRHDWLRALAARIKAAKDAGTGYGYNRYGYGYGYGQGRVDKNRTEILMIPQGADS